MPYVYRYIDMNRKEVVYVGKVTTYYDMDATCVNDGLVKRHAQHQREDWYKSIGDENLLLQYIQLKSHVDADIAETWLISYYDTGQLFNKSKTGWGACTWDLYPHLFGKWKNFRQNSYKNGKEIRDQTDAIIDLFIKATDGCRHDVNNSLEWLCKKIKDIEKDMRKAESISRFDMQEDYKRRG